MAVYYFNTPQGVFFKNNEFNSIVQSMKGLGVWVSWAGDYGAQLDPNPIEPSTTWVTQGCTATWQTTISFGGPCGPHGRSLPKGLE